MRKNVLLLAVMMCALAQAGEVGQVTFISRDAQGYPFIGSVRDACCAYPKSAEEIKERFRLAQTRARERIDALIACTSEKYTKETVLQAFDLLKTDVLVELAIFYQTKSVHPNQEMVTVAGDHFLQLNEFFIEHIDSSKQLCEVFKTYVGDQALKENLSADDRYFLKKILENFELKGLHLSAEKQKKLLILKKRCAQLESEFHRFIDQDTTTVKVVEGTLVSLPEDFKKTLERDGNLYVLPLTYPVQTMVMSYCAHEETRKKYFKAFKNKGYPQNELVLQELIKKRHEYAQILGYESYAAYDLANQMIKTPERAWYFLRDLQQKVLGVAERDFKQLVSDLPEGVSLTKEGKLEPWNYEFVATYFKKKQYSIDEQVFAEYFSMDKTIAGLIRIYEQFFNVSIEPVPAAGMWHSDVSLLQVKNKIDGAVRGYIFMDMFPRENKNGHAGVFGSVSAIKKVDGLCTPAVVTLVCNFTKPVAEKPSLLKYGEVVTFFHEFGHAIHAALGATTYCSLSGLNTEVDFIELPSQMLENWMKDKEILTMISSHYVTREPLPKELIEKRLEFLKFGQGIWVVEQLIFGMVSLELFGPNQRELPADIYKRLSENCNKHFAYDADTHRYCSLGQLTNYGAKYYGYLWTKVLGADVFEQIEKEGLLNPEAGKRYVDAILAHGGSKDANDMMRDYLGREPRFDAFYRKKGL